MEVGAHIIVNGLVQGVGFRYFVSGHARSFGLSGYVCNLHNGSVEVLAEGDRSAIEALIRELKIGPRAAHVRDVIVEWREAQHQNEEFIVR
ncbi:MAG TPA: acylphosphatase [Bacteroidota bacterium]|nr:acylphosphatase [Bacteroidota bacterium]